MRRKLLLSLIVLLFVSVHVLIAQRTVTGTVMSDADAMSMIGVNVVVEGTTTGTVTDLDGKYSIEVSDGQFLVFSYVGYQDVRESVNGRSVIDVTMSEGQQLEEVVVTALGISREKKALGYSVETVSSEDINNSGQTNLINSIQGKISGVTIRSGSGAPGSGTDILIRGMSSLDPTRSNSPLFIIDGVQMSNDVDIVDFQPSTLGSWDDTSPRHQAAAANRAIDINPDDIETISVLKGANATALYGARAANGAVIITTKKGSGKVAVEVYGSMGVRKVNKFPKYQTTYRDGYRGALGYKNGKPRNFWSHGPKVYDDQESPIRDIYGDFYRNGLTSNYGASLSGGNDVIGFRISGGRYSDKGVIPFSEWSKTNLRFGGNMKVTDKLNVSASFSYTNSGGNQPHEGQKSIMSSLSYISNTWDMTDYLNEDGTQKEYSVGIIDHPRYLAEFVSNRDNVNHYLTNIGLDYNMASWFKLKYTFGTDLYDDTRERIVPAGIDLSAGNGGFIYNGKINGKSFTSNLVGIFTKNFADNLTMNFVLGNELYSKSKDILGVRGEGFVNSEFYHLDNTENLFNYKTTSDYRTVGIYSQVEFGYLNSLYLTFTGRKDWTSTLPIGRNSYFYPSASLSWIATDMFELPEVISYAKFRYSWAKVGKDALPYNIGTYFGALDAFDGAVGFEQSTTTGNPDLTPEFTTSSEFGTDLRFMDNRFGLEFSYYSDLAEDLLIPVPVSNATGASIIYTNAGDIKNKGMEVVFKAMAIKRTNFNWDFNLNWSTNSGEVLKINNEGKTIVPYNNGSRARDVAFTYKEGGAVGDIYAYDFLRTEAGDLIIKDGYPTIDYEEKQLVGNAIPDWTAGLTNNFSFKGVKLSMLWEWKHGGDVFDMGRRNGIRNGFLLETERRFEEVVFEGVVENADGGYEQNTEKVVLDQDFYRSGSKFNNAGSMLVEDASWIRLRNITVSFDLPENLFKNSFIGGAVVSLTGNNLYLNTPFSGYDPETNYFGANSNILGYTGLKTPATKSFIASIRLKF